MVENLMMPVKLAKPGFFKLIYFEKKGYDVINFVHDVTNKILLHDSNSFVDLFMWPNFGNSSISIRDVIITLILC